MKRFYIISVLVVLFCFLFFGSLNVNAAESSVYNYTTTYEYYSGGNLWKIVRHDTVPYDYRIGYWHKVETNSEGKVSDLINLYSVNNNAVIPVTRASDIPNVVSTFDLYKNGVAEYEGADYNSAVLRQYSYVVTEGQQLRTDVPCFDDKDYLDQYLLTGDDTGQTNKGVTSEKHNFSGDFVDTDIPLVEISNVSHNGFVLNNRGDYNVDLYVESYLYGVKHSSFFPKVSFAVDTNWIYASHTYNFDSFTIATDSINMNSLFHVDNEGNLASDFIRWSSVYSKPSLLPDYAWYKTSSGSGLYDLHVYDSSLSDSANLSRSEQGCTVYYVRYYHMVDGQRVGGQWMQYTFRDGDGKATMDNGVLISSGTVVGGGKVNVDSNGDIYITDSVTGSQDLQGNITYTSDSNDLYVDSAFSVIQDMANAIGKVPHLLESLFPFLPWWCVASLGAAIIICIILRIAGR